MKSFKYALCLVVLLAGNVDAAGFDALLKQNRELQGPISSEQAQDALNGRLLEMYLWSKDSFSPHKWPSRWEQMAPQAKGILERSEAQASAPLFSRGLFLAYALLLQDYQLIKTYLAQTPADPQKPYEQMVSVLLGEEHPQRPGVWQINLQQAQFFQQRYPEWPLAQIILAEALLERQKPESFNQEQLQQAQQAVSKALMLKPELEYAKYQQGQIYFFLQREKAHAYFQAHLGAVDGVAMEAVGNFYLWMGEAESAADFYEQSRQWEPDNLRIYQKLAQIYRQHAPEKLAEAYLKGWAARPQSLPLYHHLQKVYSEVSPVLLEKMMRQHLRQRSDLQALAMGDLAVLRQDPLQALSNYQEALSLNPRQILAYLQFMEQAWQTGALGEMARLLTQAEVLGLKHPDLQYWSGVIALQQGQTASAIGLLEPLAAVSHSRARYTLALAWHQQGQSQKAQQALLSLLEEDPQNLSVLLTLGDLLAAESQWREAEKVYRLAQQLSPHDVRVYFGQAQLMGQQQKHAEAAELWERASLLAPASLEIRNNLGNAYIRLQQFKQARQIFDAILQQNPDYAVAHYNLACIEALQSHKERAYRSLERAFLLDQGLKQTARQDPDLALLRGESRFQKLVR